MSKGAPRIMLNQCMEALFRHEEMPCTTEFLITMEKILQKHHHYPVDIQTLLGKHERVFEPLLVSDHLTEDLSMSLR
jgi:hypothetical protein